MRVTTMHQCFHLKKDLESIQTELSRSHTKTFILYGKSPELPDHSLPFNVVWSYKWSDTEYVTRLNKYFK